MAVPRTKTELIRAITEDYRRLRGDLERVPVGRARERTMPGHKADTMMSPADLVAYLIGWNELVLSWHEQKARGIEPEMPAPGFTWNRLGDLAQRFYDDRAGTPWPQLLVRLDAVKDEICARVESASDEELYGAPWYGRYTAGRMIQLNTSSPYANARKRIRLWLKAGADEASKDHEDLRGTLIWG